MDDGRGQTEHYLAQLAAKLDALTAVDPEAAHLDADVVLIEALDALGGADVIKAWQRACSRVGFWYA